MNANELRDLDYEWEAEKKRRLAWKRRQHLAKRAEIITNLILIAAALIALAIILGLYLTQDKRERAAWNEGYFGVDRATAVAMAERGIGYTAAEYLARR